MKETVRKNLEAEMFLPGSDLGVGGRVGGKVSTNQTFYFLFYILTVSAMME